MRYYSLNDSTYTASFAEAAIQGQALDGGLYFPQTIPILPTRFFQDISQYSREEIAFTVLHPYVKEDLPDDELRRIVAETINFPIPLVSVSTNIYCLELFHGPTQAFKDVGARFMSRCLGYFVRNNNKAVTVLVATSGDTGGAVANGFYGVEGVNVVILYPSGKVSPVQELQLTTLGGNITALEVSGNFDDCQALVKQAFSDSQLIKQLFLTSANSINVARWLPQQVYYFLAWQQWPFKERPPVVSVPSGNFGNIGAGLLAFKSGLPVKRFIAACNANDVVPHYLAEGLYNPKKAVTTLSNAMDVGDPSNWVRIRQLFENHIESLRSSVQAESISDTETLSIIEQVYKKHLYTLDPHGAVGYAALAHYLRKSEDQKGYFLETAHPIKFYETIEPAIGQTIDKSMVQSLLTKKKSSIKIDPDYKQLKDFLLATAR